MNVNKWLRVIAGFFIIVSLGLTFFLSKWWLLFTGFVGLNLLQSGFTNWCPMMSFLRRLGVKE